MSVSVAIKVAAVSCEARGRRKSEGNCGGRYWARTSDPLGVSETAGRQSRRKPPFFTSHRHRLFSFVLAIAVAFQWRLASFHVAFLALLSTLPTGRRA